MLDWPHLYFLTALCGSALALLYTPLCQFLAVKLDFMDRPKGENHKKHAKATPLLGGLALFLAWFTALMLAQIGLASGVMEEFSPAVQTHAEGLRHVSGRMLYLIAGGAAAMLLGLLDDKFAMKAAPKFLGQFLVALIAVNLGGVRISIFLDTPFLTWLITILWFMTLMNSINFFDNMDGLAVGCVTIAMGFFALTAGIQQQFFVATLAALTAGCGVGFWFYNHAPATIFMGDSGSHFLGYLTAVISASVTYFSPESLSYFPILLPVLILSVPLFDTLSVVVIRTCNKKPFWIGDHNHLSHRFVRLGMSRKRAVLLIHLLMLVINLSVLPLLWGSVKTGIAILVQLGFLLTFLTWLLNAPSTVKPEEIKEKK